MKKLIIALAVLALFAGTAWAGLEIARPTTDISGPNRANTLFYYEDMDSGAPGWYPVDLTVGAAPKFHVDTYYAYLGGTSWWCGEINPAFISGDGYANNWDMRLDVPPTPASGGYDILTFAHRFDSEVGYDFTYVQAKSGGVYIDLNPGFNGKSPWIDIGALGYPLVYDAPHQARFRFIADGAWSDADQLYDSTAGAYHCDNVKIFEFWSGDVLFFDDVETGGLCVPSVPGAAGNYWHIVSDLCSAFSDPNSWWCGDDADTSLIPPNLQNALYSPVIDVSGAVTCTLRHLVHAEVPNVSPQDYWTESVSMDGGTTWHDLHGWVGDFAGCDGWGSSGFAGDDLTSLLVEGTDVVWMIAFFTTADGCGPGAAGGAGINLDDTWIEGEYQEVPVQDKSWSRVKSLYR
jgi:hypothetical protein